MAAPKRATHRVCKRGLYFSPEKGELEIGTQLTLTAEQAVKLEKRGMVESLKDVKSVDASEADSKALANAKNELAETKKALAKAEKDLADANDALKKATGVAG